jgi:hypothetical protein
MDDVIFDFGETPKKKAKPAPTPKTYEFGGKGKKQCQNPECAVFVGVRTKNCPICGSEFKKKTAPKAKLTPNSETGETGRSVERVIVRTSKPYNHIVHTPAGTCPIGFDSESLTPEIIIEWAEAVREWALDSRRDYLTGEAIIYYSRYTVSVFSDEYKMISDTINEWDGVDGIR